MVSETQDVLSIYLYIRRPRQMQGGARQGIIHLKLVLAVHHNNNKAKNPRTPADGKEERVREDGRRSASGKRGCGQQEIQQRVLGSFPKEQQQSSSSGSSSGSSKPRVAEQQQQQGATAASIRRPHFLWVSEVTLGSFSPPFSAFSVLHCHGASPSGGCGFARSFLAQARRFGAGQVAQKSSFSMGFRSYVRQFFAAFFRLLRPSLPWCFPVRGLWFCAVFPRPSKAFWSGTSSSEILIFYGFQKLR